MNVVDKTSDILIHARNSMWCSDENISGMKATCLNQAVWLYAPSKQGRGLLNAPFALRRSLHVDLLHVNLQSTANQNYFLELMSLVIPK